MPTTREVEAARVERVRRQQRHYTPDRLGERCPRCGTRVVADLNDPIHPACYTVAEEPHTT